MPRPQLLARIDSDGGDDASFVVRAPAVGVVDALPPVGTLVDPAHTLLTMTILGQRHQVRLPPGVQGRVLERLTTTTPAGVGYNQPLLRLGQAAATTTAGAAAAATSAAAEATGLYQVRAPSEGVFYSRPAPDAPPYVEEGKTVETGAVLGLVEVMKSFNHITYGGPGLPARGTVERCLVADAAEVAFGQVLFLLRPA